MNRKWTMSVACALALAAANAGAADKRIELSGTIGWTYSDGVGGTTAVKVPNLGTFNSIDPKNAMNWGARLGYMVTPNFEAGARYDMQASTLQISGTTTVDLGDIDIRNYHGYAAYNLGEEGGKIRPYFLGGLGATQYSAVNAKGGNVAREIRGNTKFSTTWAAGVKLFPSPSVGIRLEAAWTPTYIKSDAAGYWCDPYWGCYLVSDPQYANQFQLGGGIVFRF